MSIQRSYENQTGCRSKKPRGFSLIELMVVILIIVGLVAALMPVYSKVMMKAKKTASQNMIIAVAACLERYKIEFDAYPPNPTTGTEDDGTLMLYMNGPKGRGVEANVGTPRERHYEPFLVLGKEYIKADSSGTKLIITDSWGMPIHYFNCKDYVELKNGNPKFCHNPSSVDLYSTGPDRKKDDTTTEPGAEEVKDRKKMTPAELAKEDDITNF
ncbi:MAG: prepilin-type N-terminal cleavage/methylation domain-containing protein [Planctomycetota bacterium]